MKLGFGLSLVTQSGATAIPAGFTVNGFTAPWGALFAENKYRANGSSSTLANAVTATRASTATYVDSSGTLQTAASGELRVGHHVWDGSAWANKGALVEEQATNLATQSNNFADAVWNKSAISLTASAGVSPDGTSNAWKFVTNSGATLNSVIGSLRRQFSKSATTQDFCISVHIKQQDYDRFRILVSDGTSFGNFVTLSVDQSDGAETTRGAAGSGISIVNYQPVTAGNGFVRLNLTVNIDASFNSFLIVLDDFDTVETVADGVSGTFVYQVDVVQSSVPTSAIITNGSQVTRAADALTADAAKLPWSGTAMSLVIEGEVTYADNDTLSEVRFFRWEESASRRFGLVLNTSDTKTGTVQAFQVESGVFSSVEESAPGSLSPGVNQPFSLASTFGTDLVALAVNGTSLTPDTDTTAIADLENTALQIASKFNGTIIRALVIPNNIGETGREEATS